MKYRVLAIFSLILSACAPLKQGDNGAQKKTYKIAVISDLNSSYGSTIYNPDVYATLRELDSIKPDIILCGGDMVAGQKRSLTESQIQAMWDSFGQNILTPIKATKIPFGFTVGNHDASPTFTQERAMAKTFWQKHQQQLGLKYVDQTHYPFYFSYEDQGVFFISWDATAAKVEVEVLDWMEKQLQLPVAKNAKLRILLGHLPLYAIVPAKNKLGEILANGDEKAAFFEKNGIDLYISGHQHAYYPSFKNNLRLLNAGCIGEGSRQFIGHEQPATRAYTIIEVPKNDAKNFRYQTFIPNTGKKIELSHLPDSVVGFNGTSKKELR